jgi:hypothetical protein
MSFWLLMPCPRSQLETAARDTPQRLATSNCCNPAWRRACLIRSPIPRLASTTSSTFRGRSPPLSLSSGCPEESITGSSAQGVLLVTVMTNSPRRGFGTYKIAAGRSPRRGLAAHARRTRVRRASQGKPVIPATANEARHSMAAARSLERGWIPLLLAPTTPCSFT